MIRTAIMMTFLMLTISFNSQAQTEKNTFEQKIYFEADPLAHINKGYSLHLGYENWGWRFDLTKVKVDFPTAFTDAFYGTKAFDLRTKINGIKIDYIGNRDNWIKGAFIGIDVNHQQLNFTHIDSQASEDLTALNIGLRAGYKFNLFKGFYITPWGAVWKNVTPDKTFSVGQDQVTTNQWDWIMTAHIGYAYTF